jgi:CubicO group peptidase (beta-lactamase class C family)
MVRILSRPKTTLEGQWDARFGKVAQELTRQLDSAAGTGAAVCVYHRGRPVVDAFGGMRNAAGDPWRADTLVMAFSTGKGCAATLFHTLVDAGLAHYDDPVAKHWPEFAGLGKGAITIRQVLSHSAGLHRLGDMIDDFWQVLDFDAMVTRVERAEPAYTPGTASGYHGISFSWVLGELLRRVGKKPIAELLRTQLCEPLGLDGAYFGLPEAEFQRCAELASADEAMTLGHYALGFIDPLARALSGGRLSPRDIRAALVIPAAEPLSWNDPRLRRACLLSSTGVFTARALARMYAALASGGRLEGVQVLSPNTLSSLQAIQSYSHDRVMGLAPHWRLGYHGIQLSRRFIPNAFGHCGYRGSGAFADPERQLSFAFLHNAKAGMDAMGGGRFQRLVRAALDCADSAAA